MLGRQNESVINSGNFKKILKFKVDSSNFFIYTYIIKLCHSTIKFIELKITFHVSSNRKK
jgi:hypothetical protein